MFGQLRLGEMGRERKNHNIEHTLTTHIGLNSCKGCERKGKEANKIAFPSFQRIVIDLNKLDILFRLSFLPFYSSRLSGDLSIEQPAHENSITFCVRSFSFLSLVCEAISRFGVFVYALRSTVYAIACGQCAVPYVVLNIIKWSAD